MSDWVVESDRLRLEWRGAERLDGHLGLRPLREGLAPRSWPAAGPRLYEQTGYTLVATAAPGHAVSVRHRDPLIVGGLIPLEGGRILVGPLNFRGQVGRSSFTILVDGAPEIGLEVEVLPAKLGWRGDFARMVESVQSALSGLALAWLKATWQGGRASPPAARGARAGGAPSDVEWLALLRYALGELDRGLSWIARRPIRRLARSPEPARIERIRRLDGPLRAEIRRGRGSGGWTSLGPGALPARARHLERRARPSMDTPEHRWLASRLRRARRRLARIQEDLPAATARERATARELSEMSRGLDRLAALPPIAAARGEPPAGFASLQLSGAPGYDRAFRACQILELGLYLGGDLPFSTRDIGQLYEYWCFLTVLETVSKILGADTPPGALIQTRAGGLWVRIEGNQRVRFPLDNPGGYVEVRYNPHFPATEGLLVAQRPDLLIDFPSPGGRRLLLMDAKYRLDASDDYRRRYGAPGPPEDALNTLYRYRDAIRERADEGWWVHPVVAAAALYPHRPEPDFARARVWRGLGAAGVGAIPLLPGAEGWLESWLRAWLAP